jgi:DNA polymerase IV (DinB-like DNA polymerase)
MMIFSTYTRSKTIPVWTSDIFVIKRTAMQLLAEFIGRQKIRLVGVGFQDSGKGIRGRR